MDYATGRCCTLCKNTIARRVWWRRRLYFPPELLLLVSFSLVFYIGTRKDTTSVLARRNVNGERGTTHAWSKRDVTSNLLKPDAKSHIDQGTNERKVEVAEDDASKFHERPILRAPYKNPPSPNIASRVQRVLRDMDKRSDPDNLVGKAVIRDSFDGDGKAFLPEESDEQLKVMKSEYGIVGKEADVPDAHEDDLGIKADLSEDGIESLVEEVQYDAEMEKPPDLAKVSEDELKELKQAENDAVPGDKFQLTSAELKNVGAFLDMDISRSAIDKYDNQKLLKIVSAIVVANKTFWSTSGMTAHAYLLSRNTSACNIHYTNRPLMTLFTTFKPDLLRTFIHMNTIRNWAKYGYTVRPILYVMNDTDERLIQLASLYDWILLPMTQVNEFMTPYLKPMYMMAGVCVNSSFYGFANGDILFDDEFTVNLKEINDYFSNRTELMIVGKRTNYNLQDRTLFHPTHVRVAKDNGTLFFHYAEDYFFMKENRYPWEGLPDLVIGRPLYDNFLVFKAIEAKIETVDASLTLTALHQTGRDGNYAGQRNRTDKAHNVDILNATNFGIPDSPRGFTTACQYFSLWKNETRAVEFVDRRAIKPMYYKLVITEQIIQKVLHNGRKVRFLKRIKKSVPVWDPKYQKYAIGRQ